MRKIWIICKRELYCYFYTPIAYVFMTVFLLASGVATFYLGDFFGRGQADLAPFFSYQPWLLALFLPAVAMRLWSEERRLGTIELLLTLPISPWQAICGKYLAALLFASLTISLTCPIWVAVNYLGTPDNGVILAGYIATLLMSAAYLAVGSTMSALCKNQVIAFVLTVLCCVALNFLGNIPMLSFLSNFETISKGLLDIRSIIYFASLIMFALFANAVVVELRKAD